MDREDHKTFIPGVGFLVTSWDGSESRLFELPEAEENEMQDIDKLVTLDNAVDWANSEKPEELLLSLLGIPPWNPDADVLVTRLGDALELELEAASEEHDGQPSHYEEMQDYMGGDDWDHGQYDDGGEW